MALGYDFVLVRLSVRAFEAPGDRKLRFIEPWDPWQRGLSRRVGWGIWLRHNFPLIKSDAGAPTQRRR